MENETYKDQRRASEAQTSIELAQPHLRPNRLRTRRRPVVISIALVLGALLIGLAIHSVGLYKHYSDRADSYDLGMVDKLEAGSVAYDSNGRILGQVALKDRRVVELGEVPQHFIDALVATEDSRFYDHHGVDPKGIARAAVANLKAGGIRQGGSTITQQLARHAFDLSGRTFERKFLELFLSMRIEEKLSKDEILEHYINRIYLGSGYYGVEAASYGYFGKSSSKLSIGEAATLASIIKSPNRLSPFRNPDLAVEARNLTLRRMSVVGSISDEQFSTLTSMPLETVGEEKREQRPDYVLAAVRREAREILGQYHDLDDLRINTSVNRDIQEQATEVLSVRLERIERHPQFRHASKAELEEMDSGTADYLQGAIIVLNNETGQIVSAVGSRDFGDSEFDRVWNAKRKPGTTIAPFVYAAAFDASVLKPLDKVIDAPLDNRQVMIGGREGLLGEWGAERAENDYDGEVAALYAMIFGKNGSTVRIGQRMGLDRFEELLTDLEFTSSGTGYANTLLGEFVVSPLELVRSYTIFSNEGRLAPRSTLIESITDRDGRPLYQRDQPEAGDLVIDPANAGVVRKGLHQVFKTAPVVSRSDQFGSHLFGRNGSSYAAADNWFIGSNGQYTWGVWVGFDDGREIYEGAFAVDTALPVWNALADLLPGSHLSPPAEPEGKICVLTGKEAGPFCEHTNVGDLTVPLRLPSETGICEVHTESERNAGELLKSTPSLTDNPNLYQRFSPIKPQVDIVIGGNPWAGN
ncbi:MAG: transglycosylase domain-containing protein [Verrucomicrobiales bacterium]|nr:transglycosylase domain-containing protein [Verrucomicrobiales bacterium]